MKQSGQQYTAYYILCSKTVILQLYVYD